MKAACQIFEFHKHTEHPLQCRDLASLSQHAHVNSHPLARAQVACVKRHLNASAVVAVNDNGRVCLMFNAMRRPLLALALKQLEQIDDRAADQTIQLEQMQAMQGILETIVASAVSRGLNDTYNGSIYLLVLM